MTKDLNTIDLNLLPVETLGEMANEAAEQVEKNAKATVQKAIDCGRYLTAIKEQLEHGQWGGWLGANWNYSQKTAAQYMQISNFTSGLNLTDASSISEALRIISDSKPETVPRSQRKPADVVVSIPDDLNEINETDADDDPAPDPPTQRKTAKGSEKVSEDKKPRTAAITPEILPDEPEESLLEQRTLSDWSVAEILSFLKASADDPKKRAKELRKLADELDPPKTEKTPTRAQLVAMIPDDWSPDLQKAASDWAEYKQARAKGERIQTVRAWELALEKFTSQPSKVVISKVNKAIENSWKGWDHDSANGHGKDAKPEPRKRDMSTYYQ